MSLPHTTHVSALAPLETPLWEATTEWVHMYRTQSAMVAAFKTTYLAVCGFKYFEHIIIGTH